jgi:STE24 endopeptidase
MVTGVAGAYRIIITDTVFESFDYDEIEAIVAHEIGHQVHHHGTKRLFVLGTLYLLGLWVAHSLLPDYVADLSDASNLPYLFTAFLALHFYILLIFNFFSRAQEKEADCFCWNLTGNIDAFVRMMRKLAISNLLVQGEKIRLGTSHPALEARIAAAEAFLKAKESAASVSHSA